MFDYALFSSLFQCLVLIWLSPRSLSLSVCFIYLSLCFFLDFDLCCYLCMRISLSLLPALSYSLSLSLVFISTELLQIVGVIGRKWQKSDFVHMVSFIGRKWQGWSGNTSIISKWWFIHLADEILLSFYWCLHDLQSNMLIVLVKNASKEAKLAWNGGFDW